MKIGFHRLVVIATIVAFFVIVLGAYVRLSHAGLGCPDWPGCYGKLTWPVAETEIVLANEAYPERPVETGKAWREMVHRYLAGALVVLVLMINYQAWKHRLRRNNIQKIAMALLVLIFAQAALGMWTVTLKLLPVIVMAHLLGGLATFGMLIWLVMNSRGKQYTEPPDAYLPFRPLILAGLIVLVGQLALGGWTSANYAALACPDFPTCHGEIWPDTNFKEGFVLFREIGVDYEGGVLDQPSRTAIHLAHRFGAVVTFLVLGILAVQLSLKSTSRSGGVLLAVVLCAQVLLGILNVVLYLPLPNAVAHNGTGALLLAVMIWLTHRSKLRFQ